MRILVLSDIHGNVDALQAVLSAAGPLDQVVCLGDLVGYGPNPNEVVEQVRGLKPLACLVGNHDLAALGEVPIDLFNTDAAGAARWTGERLRDDHAAWLRGLHSSDRIPDAYLAHGSPRDPIWEYMELPGQGPPNFDLYTEHLCFVGHTHVPRLFEQAAGKGFTPVHALGDGDRVRVAGEVRLIINPGSVGQPRDGDWRASYGIWDPHEGWFQLHRIDYPVERVQRKILDAGLPASLGARLRVGR